jgi:DNA-binding XRE family transcriptional regulator
MFENQNPTKDAESLSFVIKNYRKKNSITQVEFSKIMDLDVATIIRWEKGRHHPSKKTRKKLKSLGIVFSMPLIICINCNSTFKALKVNQKFCSRECGMRYRSIKNFKILKLYREQYLFNNPWQNTYKNIITRCSYKKHSYFKRGIKNFLTSNDVRFLWFRDKAYLLKQPSIDRKDSKGNYTLKNCRFIEMKENLNRREYGKK